MRVALNGRRSDIQRVELEAAVAGWTLEYVVEYVAPLAMPCYRMFVVDCERRRREKDLQDGDADVLHKLWILFRDYLSISQNH
jgi:hypothetical protein